MQSTIEAAAVGIFPQSDSECDSIFVRLFFRQCATIVILASTLLLSCSPKTFHYLLPDMDDLEVLLKFFTFTASVTGLWDQKPFLGIIVVCVLIRRLFHFWVSGLCLRMANNEGLSVATDRIGFSNYADNLLAIENIHLVQPKTNLLVLTPSPFAMLVFVSVGQDSLNILSTEPKLLPFPTP